MKNHILLAWVRPSAHYSQSVLKAHTISSSISLIFCTVVMVALSNTGEDKAALLTLPISTSRRSLSSPLQQGRRRRHTHSFIGTLTRSTVPRTLFWSVLRWSDFAGQSLSSAANKPTFFPISPWVARKVQSGSERRSQTTRYAQRFRPGRPADPS
jgi:hypothetical protein